MVTAVHVQAGEAVRRGQTLLDEPTQQIGVYRMTRPEITEVPIEVGLVVVVFTDGVTNAGQRRSQSLDAAQAVDRLYAMHRDHEHVAQPIADGLLVEVLELDEGRASDDVSILALAVSPNSHDEVRRLHLHLPIPPLQRP